MTEIQKLKARIQILEDSAIKNYALHAKHLAWTPAILETLADLAEKHNVDRASLQKTVNQRYDHFLAETQKEAELARLEMAALLKKGHS